MNRLFIIGNGFDLAHGLPTSYNDFINSFWSNLNMTYKDGITKKLVLVDDMNYGYINYSKNPENFDEFIQNVVNYSNEYRYKFEEINYSLINQSGKYIFKFQSKFFLLINKNQSIDNWVDIENLYYSELKRIVKSENLFAGRSEDDWRRIKKEEIKVLNSEFNDVKELLKLYLNNEVVSKYDFKFSSSTREWLDLYNLLRPISIFNNETKLFSEFYDSSDVQRMKSVFEDQKRTQEEYFNSYFLNFNYTPTLSEYAFHLNQHKLNSYLNHIHGDLNNDIIFGFGDETDEDYRLIENINDNEYLNFFKSFEYLENNHYSDLLKFINSEKFQLIVMGHSLGLSDRVLLKTILENENCKSIKVYYYKGKNSDNFRDIIQNMSRHFSDKSVMRKKVLNKLLCKPLPQIQIPLKN